MRKYNEKLIFCVTKNNSQQACYYWTVDNIRQVLQVVELENMEIKIFSKDGEIVAVKHFGEKELGIEI